MAKRAIQRLVVGEDGRLRTILIDLATLEEVANPEGYYVVNQGETEPEPVADVDQPDVPHEPGDVAHAEERRGSETSPGSYGSPKGIASDQRAPARQAEQQRSVARRAVAQALDPDEPGQPKAAPTLGRPDQRAMPSAPTPSNPTPSPQAPVGDNRPAPSAQSNVTHSNKNAQRNQEVDQGFASKLGEAVRGYFGEGYTANVTSGKGRLAGKKGNANHPSGFAADFDVIDPQGNVVDNKTMEDFGAYAAAKGFTGVGIGPGYMTPGRMHLDTVHTAPAAWGAAGTKNTMSPGAFKGITQAGIAGAPVFGMGLPGPGAPTPTARPDPMNIGTQGLTPSRMDFNQPAEQSVAQGVVSQAKDVSKPAVDTKSTGTFDNKDLSKASAASFASMGLIDRDEASRQAISKALTGEMSRSQLSALAANDPTARAELANMISTVENRMASKVGQKVGIAGVLAPDQINSMADYKVGDTVPMENTKALYAEFGTVVDQAVNDFYAGKLEATVPDASHYHANYANPDWSNPSFSAVGDHKFGTTAGRFTGIGPGFAAERDRMSSAQRGTTRGYTPSKDYSGSGYSGNQDSPSEKSGARGSGSGFASRSDHGSFGTSRSPGVGRSSISSGEGSGGRSYGNSGTGSSGLSGGRGGMVSGENAGRSTSSSSKGRSGSSVGQVGGSPTNDGKGGAKSPGGGF